MIRYPLTPPETLFEAIIKAGTLATTDPDLSYMIVCSYCGKSIDNHVCSVKIKEGIK